MTIVLTRLASVVSVLFLLDQCLAAEQTCYADNNSPYLRFASKTDWRVTQDGGEQITPAPECEPIQLWSLIRPGVHWPAHRTVERIHTLHLLREDIIGNHEQGKGQLCSKDIENLRETGFPPKDLPIPQTMADQGTEDMKNLGEKMKNMFPSLLKKPFTFHDYEFRYWTQPNIQQSLFAFTSGLFGPEFNVGDIPKPWATDSFLAFSENCNKWRMEVIDGRAGERAAFDRISMRTLVEDVSNRLGFKETLEIGNIVLMYQACSMGKATAPYSKSAWCAVFTTSELKLLEYREDLYYYQACGPGDNSRLVSQLSCPLVKDMLSKFSSAEKGLKKPSVDFFFADEKSLLVLLHGLGLVGTTIGTIDTMDRRTFRTSELAPFAANFVAVLHRCSKGEKFRVGYYLGGRLVGADGKETKELQSWYSIREELASYYVRSSQCAVDYCTYSRISVVLDGLKLIAQSGGVLTLFGMFLALTPR